MFNATLVSKHDSDLRFLGEIYRNKTLMNFYN
jgi:hypothetical protein